VEHDSTSNRLLLHVFDLVDEQHWIDLIKQRYEYLLLEILA
jgi:multicomponent K+:H+ antiporter subunit E